jgi:hypothetical protein
MPTLARATMTSETTVALVEAIRESLPASHEWDERESALLSLAARQAADIDRLEADLAESGVRVPGRGGEVLNQAFCEVRQGRVALARILGQVNIPESLSPRSLHGRKAAEARWREAG